MWRGGEVDLKKYPKMDRQETHAEQRKYVASE